MHNIPRTLLALLAVTMGLLTTGCWQGDRPEHAALSKLPGAMAWAWERPEDLTWIPNDAGVAFVAMAIVLEGDRVVLRPRAHPLKVRGDTVLVPVIHVDASNRHPPMLNHVQRDAIVSQLLAFAQSTQAPVVQLDFEVRKSQRAFLQEVVTTARRALPAQQALSMTALASWCAGDYWLSDVPADEIVPMVFRMAQSERSLRATLAANGRLPRRRCQSAIGFATDEAVPDVPAKRRYYFSPVAWTREGWQARKS